MNNHQSILLNTIFHDEALVVSSMKVGDYEVPEGFYFTKEHEWLQIENGNCRVGITDYAQKTLHEVVYVDLPNLNKMLTQNATFGTVESVKAVSELYSPISGAVIQRNEKLVNSPELVNQDPYGAGWIVVVKPSRIKDELDDLLNQDSYVEFLKELGKKQ
jgi:glycine cleavage system H protein